MTRHDAPRPATSGRRRAFTLPEVMIATGLALLIAGVVIRVLVSGSRLFVSGIAAARGPEAALLLMDRFEEDITAVLQVPGDPRPPMATDTARLAFYKQSPGWTTPSLTVGEPVIWELDDGRDLPHHPVRNGEVLEGIEIDSWSFQVLEPDLESDRPGWYLAFSMTFPTGGGKPYTLSRLVHLPQPSANFLYFPAFGGEILPGAVRLLPPPEREPLFETLAPPDPEAPGSRPPPSVPPVGTGSLSFTTASEEVLP